MDSVTHTLYSIPKNMAVSMKCWWLVSTMLKEGDFGHVTLCINMQSVFGYSDKYAPHPRIYQAD